MTTQYRSRSWWWFFYLKRIIVFVWSKQGFLRRRRRGGGTGSCCFHENESWGRVESPSWDDGRVTPLVLLLPGCDAEVETLCSIVYLFLVFLTIGRSTAIMTVRRRHYYCVIFSSLFFPWMLFARYRTKGHYLLPSFVCWLVNGRFVGLFLLSDRCNGKPVSFAARQEGSIQSQQEEQTTTVKEELPYRESSRGCHTY